MYLRFGSLTAVSVLLTSVTFGAGTPMSVASDRPPTRGPAAMATEFINEPAIDSMSPSPSSDDAQFLQRIRKAGITEAMISDDQAISAAQRILYLVCDRNAPSRMDTAGLLVGKYGMNPQQKIDFTQAALQVYRHTSDTNNCGSATH